MLKILFQWFLVLTILNACNPQNSPSEVTKEAQNQDILLAFLEKGWNEQDTGSAELYFSNSFTRMVNNVKLASNQKELSANMQVYFTGFPDLEIKIDTMIADGDQIFFSWTITGTNTGIFGDLKATGKKIKIKGMSRVEFDEESKIIYEDVYYNELSLLQQMGHTLNPPILD